jgi:hypothetical protein
MRDMMSRAHPTKFAAMVNAFRMHQEEKDSSFSSLKKMKPTFYSNEK